VRHRVRTTTPRHLTSIRQQSNTTTPWCLKVVVEIFFHLDAR
jgi:hypothetical protein